MRHECESTHDLLIFILISVCVGHHNSRNYVYSNEPCDIQYLSTDNINYIKHVLQTLHVYQLSRLLTILFYINLTL